MSDDIFADGDPFNDPAWRKMKRRRAERMIGCPLSWFGSVVPRVKGKSQLAMAFLLYRRCCICKSATITVPTHEFESLDISRYGKYRLLLALERVGIIRVETRRRGQVGKVTLINWPEPP